MRTNSCYLALVWLSLSCFGLSSQEFTNEQLLGLNSVSSPTSQNAPLSFSTQELASQSSANAHAWGLNLYSAVSNLPSTQATFDGMSSLNILTGSYSWGENRVSFTNRTVFDRPKGVDGEHIWERSALSYTRSALLNQEQHFFNLSTTVKYRYVPDAPSRNRGGTYGLGRVETKFSRALENGWSFSQSLYYALYHQKQEKPETVNRDYYSLLTTQNYDFNDKWSVSFYQELFHLNKERQGERATDGGKIQDYTEYLVGIEGSYNINAQASAILGVSALPCLSHDGRLLAKQWEKELTYSVALYLSAF